MVLSKKVAKASWVKKITQLASFVRQSCLDFLFPTSCLFCRELLSRSNTPFCPTCVSLFEPIQPLERCPYCFSIEVDSVNRHCASCRQETRYLYRQGAVFDYIGPPAALIKNMKYAQKPYLAKGAAAFMVAQWARMEWEMPDLVVPVPMALTHWLERGYNQSELISAAIADLLGKPMKRLLKRKSGDYSQAGLSLHQRKTLTGKHFYLDSRVHFQDKVILLIDDVATSGTTLNRCAQALIEGHPSRIYGLTFCRT